MAYACISIIGAPDPKDDKISPEGGEASAIGLITYPMVKLAERLGVTSIKPGREVLPPGVWVSDGTGDGAAYNFIEIIDRLTERIEMLQNGAQQDERRTGNSETENGSVEHEKGAEETVDRDSRHDEEGGVSGDS